MTLLDFLVLCLAASAVVDVWFNGSIFAEWRAYAEALDDTEPCCNEELPTDIPLEPIALHMRWMVWLPSRVLTLILCRYCFSHHTPWIVAVTCFVPGLFLADPWAALCKLPAYCLAATRLGNIINACIPKNAQYFREQE